MFDDEFIESLPTDLVKAGTLMCEKFMEIDSSGFPEDEMANYNAYLEAYAAIETLVNVLDFPISLPVLTDDRLENLSNIRKFIHATYGLLEQKKDQDVLSKGRAKFKAKFKVGFFYRFSDGDLQRIQTLINELRDLIKTSELFDAKHKERMLTKLEKLQLDLHKQMSSLDKFWGLIGEAGVVLGKFGKDAKPFVDRIREVAQIVWRTQAISEELPSGTSLPLLSDGDPKEDDRE